MQAGDVRLGQVFANDQQNVIPLFQRPYVWDEVKNWEPLWQDIRQAAEGVEEEARTGSIQTDPRTYFLGAVVLQQRRKRPQQISSWNVVDGQQQLTTLQILFAAARSFARELGEASLCAKFASLIENNPDIIHKDFPDDRYKVWPLPQDRDVFLWAVRHPDDVTPPAEPDHRIARARAWFEAAIREWAMDSEDPSERLEFLHETRKERMELVQITLESNDDPQVIFEVLNHRGVPLDAADLVKNLLFQALDTKGHSSLADELLMNSWLPLDKTPWRGDVTTGRIKRKLIDLLLSYWLTIRTGNEVVVEHLFADFKKWLHESGEDAAEVIRSIRHYADRMLAIRALPDTDPTAQLVDRMEATQTTTPWPLLLYLHGNDQIPDAQRDRAAKAIDSFLMRRAACRLTTKDYNRLFLQVLAAAHASDPGCAGDAVKDTLLGQMAESRKWPIDDEFVASLTQSNVFNLLVRARLKAVLVGVENHLRTDKTEPGPLLKSADLKLNIEHLLPQSWEKTWPLDNDPSDEYYDEHLRRRRDAVHQLGNLTLTTTKLNPSLSNKPWKQKRKDIQEHSLLRLTTASVLTAPDSVDGMEDDAWASKWDEERIKVRGGWLADQALLAWPRPPTEHRPRDL
jgi:hypothetical protein